MVLNVLGARTAPGEDEMASERIRLAMVGCGGMARAHLNGYERLRSKEIDSFEIAAVCDPATERAGQFGAEIARWSAPPAIYADLEEMLRRERLAAADIATPHFLHHTTAIACMEAGLHVLLLYLYGEVETVHAFTGNVSQRAFPTSEGETRGTPGALARGGSATPLVFPQPL